VIEPVTLVVDICSASTTDALAMVVDGLAVLVQPLTQALVADDHRAAPGGPVLRECLLAA
jgi:hypothetical protein